MIFTCSVVLEHLCMQQNNGSAHKELALENTLLDAGMPFRRDRDAPFTLTPRLPLFLLIVDDQATVICGWPDALVRKFIRNYDVYFRWHDSH